MAKFRRCDDRSTRDARRSVPPRGPPVHRDETVRPLPSDGFVAGGTVVLVLGRGSKWRSRPRPRRCARREGRRHPARSRGRSGETGSPVPCPGRRLRSRTVDAKRIGRPPRSGNGAARRTARASRAPCRQSVCCLPAWKIPSGLPQPGLYARTCERSVIAALADATYLVAQQELIIGSSFLLRHLGDAAGVARAKQVSDVRLRVPRALPGLGSAPRRLQTVR